MYDALNIAVSRLCEIDKNTQSKTVKEICDMGLRIITDMYLGTNVNINRFISNLNYLGYELNIDSQRDIEMIITIIKELQ